VCYCADCQAFARFLKRENEILDERGGTSIIQTIPANVTFAEGIGEDKPKSTQLLSGTLRAIGMMLKARIDGSYKHTPFFVLESGVPIVTPKVLSDWELKDIMDAV
jgi:hypothetical protein